MTQQMTVNIMMYIVIVFYNLVDSLQTIMLLETELIYEANPIQAYFIDLTGTNNAIFAVKVVPIILLGIGLYLLHKPRKRIKTSPYTLET